MALRQAVERIALLHFDHLALGGRCLRQCGLLADGISRGVRTKGLA